MYVCNCACMRVCVRIWPRARMRAYVRASVCVHAHASTFMHGERMQTLYGITIEIEKLCSQFIWYETAYATS